MAGDLLLHPQCPLRSVPSAWDLSKPPGFSASSSLLQLPLVLALPPPPSFYLPFSSQLAIRRYKLFNLQAEFFINTCDLPFSFDSSTLPVDLAGLPVFSTEHAKGSIDILYPDPLDLTGGYITAGKRSVSIGHLRNSWQSHESRDCNFELCSASRM